MKLKSCTSIRLKIQSNILGQSIEKLKGEVVYLPGFEVKSTKYSSEAERV